MCRFISEQSSKATAAGGLCQDKDDHNQFAFQMYFNTSDLPIMLAVSLDNDDSRMIIISLCPRPGLPPMKAFRLLAVFHDHTIYQIFSGVCTESIVEYDSVNREVSH